MTARITQHRADEHAALDRIEALHAKWGPFPPSGFTGEHATALRAAVLAGDVATVNRLADTLEALAAANDG